MNFIHSLKDKAQTYLPPSSEQQATSGGSPTGDETQKQTNPAITGLSHALRSLQVQHFPNAPQSTRNLQVGITAQKGVALDYDTVARDLDLNGQKLYNWVGALEGREGEVGLGFEAKTLISLSSQLGPLHHQLSQALLAARQPLKNLRNAEIEIYNRESKLRPLEAKLVKVGGRKEEAEVRAEVERLEGEIKELSYSLPDLRVEALREGERLSWAAYKQFATDMLLLSHAAESLLPHLPQRAEDLRESSTRDKTQKTEAERKARDHLAGNSGWTVNVSEGSSNTSSSYTSSGPAPPIPQSSAPPAGFEKPHSGSFDHLNNAPAPLPPVSSPPINTDQAPASALPPPTHPDSALRQQEAPLHSVPPPVGTDATAGLASPSPAPVEAGLGASHPTMAETGIPVAAGTNGPSHGQLERRSNDMSPPAATGQGIVRLSSLGGEGMTSGKIVPEPGMPQDTTQLANPFDGPEEGRGKEPAAAPLVNPFGDASATNSDEARRLKREEAQKEAERQIQEAQLRASQAAGGSGLGREQTLPRYEENPHAAPVSDVKH